MTCLACQMVEEFGPAGKQGTTRGTGNHLLLSVTLKMIF